MKTADHVKRTASKHAISKKRGPGKSRTERRSESRYDIQVECEIFHLSGANHLVWAGSGTTLNWSRKTILVRPNTTLTAGKSVQLLVRWSPGVKLVVTGRVSACDERGVVVRMSTRRFQGTPEFVSANLPRQDAELILEQPKYMVAG